VEEDMADIDNALRKADLFQTLQSANRDGFIDQDVLEIDGVVSEDTIHDFILQLVDKMIPNAEIYRNEEGTTYGIREKDFEVYKDKIKLIKENKIVDYSEEENGFVIHYTEDSNAYHIYKFLQNVVTISNEERENQKNAPVKKEVKAKSNRPKTTQEKLNEIIERKRQEREGGR